MADKLQLGVEDVLGIVKERDDREGTVAGQERTADQAALRQLEQRVDALLLAITAAVPDAGPLAIALMRAPRARWKDVLDAFTVGQAKRNRGAGI